MLHIRSLALGFVLLAVGCNSCESSSTPLDATLDSTADSDVVTSSDGAVDATASIDTAHD